MSETNSKEPESWLYTARYRNPTIPTRGVVPVRITLGAPRFPLGYAIADTVGQLAPPGYLFHIQNRVEFEPRYREHLDRIGVDWVRARLQGIHEAHGGRPLALLCFEYVADGEWCHRLCFAQWWFDRAGERVSELPETDATPTRLF